MPTYSPEARAVADYLRQLLGDPPPPSRDELEPEPEGFVARAITKGTHRGQPAYLIEHPRGISPVIVGNSFFGIENIGEQYKRANTSADRDQVVLGLSQHLPWTPWVSDEEYKNKDKRQRMVVQFLGLDWYGNANFINRPKSGNCEWGFAKLGIKALEDGWLPAMGLHFVGGWRRLKAALAVLPTPEAFEAENEANPWPRNAYPEDPVKLYSHLYGRVKALEPR
jgi:hypothetical protein